MAVKGLIPQLAERGKVKIGQLCKIMSTAIILTTVLSGCIGAFSANLTRINSEKVAAAKEVEMARIEASKKVAMARINTERQAIGLSKLPE